MKLTKGSYTVEGTPTELAEFVKLMEPPLLTSGYITVSGPIKHSPQCEKMSSNWMSILPPQCTCGAETPNITYLNTKTETGSYTGCANSKALPPDAFTTTYGVAPSFTPERRYNNGPYLGSTWLPHEDAPKVSK